MSQTISVGVVGPSYWAYMAAVMAECLQEIAQSNRIEAGQVPGGVFHDAVEFSDLALEATRSTTPDNPPASLNAYGIAADVIRMSSTELSRSRREVDQQLAQYGDFIKKMTQPRTLRDRERETAEQLRMFFLNLKEQGEAEAYENSVALGPVPIGLRHSE